MPLHIVRDDLANMRTDAVIVPANSALRIGGGAGEAVARIAGMDRLQAACDEIGGCPVGKAVVTPAFDFPANIVVHAVGPVWHGGLSGESDALHSCVYEALQVAAEHGVRSMALPLLSTGAFGFPMGEAIDIETRAIQQFLRDHESDIWLVLYDRSSMRAGRAMFDEIEEYIDDVYVGEHGFERTAIASYAQAVAPAPANIAGNHAASKGKVKQRRRFLKRRKREDSTKQVAYQEKPAAPSPEEFMRVATKMDMAAPQQFDKVADSETPQSLAERLTHLDESFAQTVLRLIDERGMTDVEVYKRANMSRQLFAKIRKDDGYRPTKKTACALVFALGLNRNDALALLSRAGFTLSHSSKFDVIVEYFLVNDIHDIFQVNEALFAYDQPLLG